MNYSVITMREVQPQLSRLLQDRRKITPVRLGRGHTPVVVLVPWPYYVAWRVALITPPAEDRVVLEEIEKDISEVAKLFLSYIRRVAPLLTSEMPVVRAIVVKVHGQEVGAVIEWQDWQRAALPDELIAERTRQPVEQDRVFAVVTASRHLSQFAREQEQGVFRPVTVTYHGKPMLVIVPFTGEEHTAQSEESMVETMPESTAEQKWAALLVKRAQAALISLQSSSALNLLNPEFVSVVSQALEAFLDIQRRVHKDIERE